MPEGTYDLDQLLAGIAVKPEAASTPVGKRYVDRSGLHVIELATDAQNDNFILRGHDGRLYRYVNGVYRPDGDDYIRAQCRDLLGSDFKKHYIEEVLAWFRTQLPTIGHSFDPRLINVRNGLLDWKTGELLPHDPYLASTVQIPVAWNPDATAPRFRSFLNQVVPGCEELVEELFGYALYTGLPFTSESCVSAAAATARARCCAS